MARADLAVHLDKFLCKPILGDPVLIQGLDWMIPSCPFQPQILCYSVNILLYVLDYILQCCNKYNNIYINNIKLSNSIW